MKPAANGGGLSLLNRAFARLVYRKPPKSLRAWRRVVAIAVWALRFNRIDPRAQSK
jgi:hypothetical protein